MPILVALLDPLSRKGNIKERSCKILYSIDMFPSSSDHNRDKLKKKVSNTDRI
jgi:hypothetical protein